MDTESKRKILGAFIVGFALVGGAYTLSSIEAPGEIAQVAAVAQPTTAPRSAISVVDADGNGIEDWRDDFVTTKPLILPNSDTATEYTGPTTVTGAVGVDFIQGLLEARTLSQNPEAEQAVIDATVERLERETSGTLYDTFDIEIITDWDEEDVRNYANVMGNSIANNSVDGLESELVILRDILSRENYERVEELETIAGYYRLITSEALVTPVPVVFVKEHLDLINTYNAIAIDVQAMTDALEDPAVTLMRMRKYEDNVLGLELALGNMYKSLASFGGIFNANDAALVFSVFAPQQRI